MLHVHSCRALLQGMDAYEFAEPAAILNELGKDFWEMLAAKKWSERRDALAKLRTLASAPKLASGDYGDVNRCLPCSILFERHQQLVCSAYALHFLSKSDVSHHVSAGCPVQHVVFGICWCLLNMAHMPAEN